MNYVEIAFDLNETCDKLPLNEQKQPTNLSLTKQKPNDSVILEFFVR